MTDAVIQIRTRVAADSKEPDFLFLFACRLAWLREQDEKALEILFAAAQASDPQTRVIGQLLLQGVAAPIQPAN